MTISILALELAGNYDPSAAIVGGLLGAIAMLAVIYAGKSMGMTSMDLLRSLDTMVLPKANSSTVYSVGLMMQLMMGTAFGLAHAGLLHAVGPSTDAAAAGLGALFGIMHGIGVTTMMPPMLTMAHPAAADGSMIKPGNLMTGFGAMTPLGVLMAHAVFGLVAATSCWPPWAAPSSAGTSQSSSR